MISRDPKRIFFNGRFLAQPLTGVQRYSREVLKALDALISAGEVDAGAFRLEILAPPEPVTPLPLKNIPTRQVGRLKGNLWEQMDLCWQARSGLLVDLGNIGPALHPNQAVTIHDASVFAVPEAYSRSFRLKYQVIFRVLGRTARRIFTDSQFSKQEIARYCDIRPEAIQVVPLGREHILEVQADTGVFEKFGVGRRPYALAVSSNSPHKNFAGLVRAVEQLGKTDFEVIIVGGTYSKVFQAAEIRLPESVRGIGYVSDPELRALYEGAACFIYPSYYEGFGLPPLEAMTLGCPVVVARAASLPEVCGDAAIYCDPHDPSDIADKLAAVMDDAGMRADLRARGCERAQLFSWPSTALALWERLH